MTTKPITPNSQLYRVVTIASRGFYTLNEIQKMIKAEFHTHDQETSISARLREAANDFGYEKGRQLKELGLLKAFGVIELHKFYFEANK